MDRLGQVAVELDDVRAHPHHLAQARVAGSGVVERDSGATLAKVAEDVGECIVVVDELVLGDLEDDVREVRRQGLGHRLGGDRRGAHVEGEVGPDRSPHGLERRPQRRRLELRSEAAAVSLGEPGVRRAAGRAREAGECLVADQVTAGQCDHRLEDRPHRARMLEQRRDLAGLPFGPCERYLPRIEAAGPDPGASPISALPRRAGRGSRRRRRRRGRSRSRPSRRARARTPRSPPRRRGRARRPGTRGPPPDREG